jgi:hypothetical protein
MMSAHSQSEVSYLLRENDPSLVFLVAILKFILYILFFDE